MTDQTIRHVLSVNSGSSSLKFRLFASGADERLVVKGAATDLGHEDGRLRLVGADGAVLEDKALGAVGHERAADEVIAALSSADLPRVDAVGHRVVHGGPNRSAPELVTPALVADLRDHVAWAPLHLPPSLTVIAAMEASYPGLSQVACFDTAFHAAIPEVARRLPLPAALHDEGVRKFGFHGLSYEYVLGVLGKNGQGRLIMAHLGNGSSMAACVGGRPVETTMGMTPMGGFMMGTRPGDLDPGVLLYLLRQKGYGPDALERLLDKESGLKGVSGETGDMETLLQMRSAGHPGATMAVEMYCYQARKAVGALAAAMGGLDCLAFTGGIGENAAPVRAEICASLGHLGIELDPAANAAIAANAVHAALIGGGDRGCEVRVVPTDEESMIARHTYRLVFGPGADTRTGRRGSKEE